jgi:hypothetical protein
MRKLPQLGTLILALAIGGCRVDSEGGAPPAGTAVRQQGGVIDAQPATIVPADVSRPMSARREAQVLLDSAIALLGADESAPVATLLDRAAAFFLVQASSPPSGGTAELIATADSLDAMADRLTAGHDADAAALRSLSARANLAEAERHGALASVAWSIRSKESMADELLMAADHVERAAVDGGIAMPRDMRRLLAEMRALAVRLPAAPGIDVQALDEPLADLHLRIAAMRQRLADPARQRP